MAQVRNNSLPELQEEIAFLEAENERKDRIIQRRDNTIKRLKEKLSGSKLRAKMERQAALIRHQGGIIQRLKREKEALHEYVERRINGVG